MSAKSGVKKVLQDITEAFEKKKLNLLKGPTLDETPTLRFGGGEPELDGRSLIESKGFEARSYPKTPNDKFLGYEEHGAKKLFEHHGVDAVKGTGVLDTSINFVGRGQGGRGGANLPHYFDTDGYATPTKHRIKVPVYADPDFNVPIKMGPTSGTEKVGGKTKKEIFDDLINKGRDYEPNARAKARGEPFTEPKAPSPAKSFSEVGENAVGDIAKIGAIGGTVAGATAVGRSIWSQQKDATRK